MRKISVLLPAVFLLCAVPLFAEDYAPLEVFGGYNFIHFSGDKDDINPDHGFGTLLDEYGLKNANGWNMGLTVNVWDLEFIEPFNALLGGNAMLGIKAEAAGAYSGNETRYGDELERISSRTHSFMAGPQISAWNNSSFTPFAHFLAGFAKTGFTHENLQLQSGQKEYDTVTGFAAAIGGGVDVSMGKHWNMRGQLDFIPTILGREFANRQDPSWSRTLNSVRITFGIVFKLGK